MHVDLGQQVVVDLGRALAGAHQGDRLLALQLRLVSHVGGVVDEVAAGPRARRGDVRRGAGAQDQAAGQVGLALVGVDRVEPGGLVVGDLGDGGGVQDVVEAVGGPAAVVVVLGPQRVEALADVEGVQPVLVLQVVQEGEGRGRVGEGHQVRHERRLQVRAVQEHAGVPLEVRLRLDEEAVELVDRRGQAGESQIEGTEADSDEVTGLTSGRQGTLPGTARRVRRGGRGRPRCRPSWSAD